MTMQDLDKARALLYSDNSDNGALYNIWDNTKNRYVRDYILGHMEGCSSEYPEHMLWRCVLIDVDLDSQLFTPDLGEYREFAEDEGKLRGWFWRVNRWWSEEWSQETEEWMKNEYLVLDFYDVNFGGIWKALKKNYRFSKYTSFYNCTGMGEDQKNSVEGRRYDHKQQNY